MVQVLPGATASLHVFVLANSVVVCTDEITNGAFPLFVIVTGCGALVVPIA
jgi:hypothetical protein